MAKSKAKKLPKGSKGSMKIGTKIFALVGFCLGLLLLNASVSIWQMDKIGGELKGIAERDLPLTEALTKITVHQLEQAVDFERAFRAAETMSVRPQAKEEFEKSSGAFKKLATKVEAEFKEAEEIAAHANKTAITEAGKKEFAHVLHELEVLDAKHTKYDHGAIEIFELLKSGRMQEARTLLHEVEEAETKMVHGLEALLLEVEKFTLNAAITAESHEKTALLMQMVLTIIAFAVGLVTAFFLITKGITRPLNDVVKGITALNNDDLSVDVKVYNDDEIGAVAKSYAMFKETMQKAKEMDALRAGENLNKEQEAQRVALVTNEFRQKIGEIITTVASASTEMNNTAQSMEGISDTTNTQISAVSSATNDTASNVQTVAAAAEEMSASIAQIGGQVTQASEISSKAVKDVSNTAVQMENLALVADKIGAVVSMISDIAEQTNLLALNATIESARAGEAGKGFAVVASEVKALASETGKATESISEHINEIQSATRDAVSSITEIGKVVGQLESTSAEISSAMDEQSAATQEVARCVAEAATGTKEVSSTIIEVTATSGEAKNAANDVTTAAQELSVQAELMRTEIENFLNEVQAA